MEAFVGKWDGVDSKRRPKAVALRVFFIVYFV